VLLFDLGFLEKALVSPVLRLYFPAYAYYVGSLHVDTVRTGQEYWMRLLLASNQTPELLLVVAKFIFV
jgi:hypothetical protein